MRFDATGNRGKSLHSILRAFKQSKENILLADREEEEQTYGNILIIIYEKIRKTAS